MDFGAEGDPAHLRGGGGVKAATIRDVAHRAEVSVASVSRVLNGAGPVTEMTRNKVLEAAKALQYVPHSGARSLSTSKTQTIGVILPDLYGEFFSELIRGMDLAARSLGYHLIVSSSHDDAEEASAAIRSMRGRVDGLIVLSPHLDAANLAAGLAGRTPILLMNGGADAGGANCAPMRSSPPTTSWPSAPCWRCRTPVCASLRTSPSSASMTCRSRLWSGPV